MTAQVTGLSDTQQWWAIGLIGAAFLGAARLITFLDKRDREARKEAIASLQIELENIRQENIELRIKQAQHEERIRHLEDRNSVARACFSELLVIAARENREDYLTLLRKGVDALH